ncbi:MAG: AMP-binding protein [Candidatus Eremiobacteraeota bacterium]|nr:AMP-binding protein [Candidatus Eremiobacteraeota bacterium]
MSPSAHVDTFARDHLPARELWPDFTFDLPALQYPQRLNCASDLLDAPVARGHGERRAIVTEERSLTYAELLADANRIAGMLRDELGLVPGNRVLLRGFNDAVLAAAWLAVIKAGGVVVTTMPLLRAKELRSAIELAQIEFALCDRRVAPDLQAALDGDSPCRRVVYWHDDASDSLGARIAVQTPAFENVDTAADDVCMIAFTSGTTGRPKGTMHFHRDVLAICDTFPPATFAPTPEDLFTGTPPLGFTFGLGGLLLFPLHAGAATLLVERPTPTALLAAIERHGATIAFTAPTSYRAMAALVPRYDLRTLRACVSAGETLPVATRTAWRERTGVDIIDGLGSTEMLHVFISAAGADVRPGATGKAVPGFTARIIDDGGRPLPPAFVGRLAVKGPTGCRYLSIESCPKVGASEPVGDPRQREYVQDGWNVTGDAYVMDADGYFWYQGRTDDMIVSSGYNIAAADVESALLDHPHVAECAVVGVPDDARGSIIKAFVVLHEESERAMRPSVADLQNFVKAHIAPYKYPRAIEFVAALPRTETGKLQRFKLRNPESRA